MTESGPDAGTSSRRALWATVTATLLIAAFVGGKAARDSLFLDAFSAAELPKAMLVSAVLSAFGVVVMARGMARLAPARLVPALCVLSALLFVVEHQLILRRPTVGAALTYLHVAVAGSLIVSGFWSVVGELFDPHTAKRVVGRIGAGAAFGGLLGGAIAERVASYFPTEVMLLVLAGITLLSAVTLLLAVRGADVPKGSGAGLVEGLAHFGRIPYLRLIGVLVLIMALTSGLLDYAFKAEAAATVTNREALTRVFAVFYTMTGIVTFGLQSLASRRVLNRLGIGGTIALLPALVLLGGAVAGAVLRFATVVGLRAVEAVLANSLYRSGYELLFTPLSPDTKRPTKTIIDVGFDRVGSALASGAIMLLLVLAPALTTRVTIIAAATLSLLALWVALRLHRGYVDELASSLLSGRVDLDESEIIDATTRRTLAETTMALDRNKLLAEIEELRARQEDDEGPDDGRRHPLAALAARVEELCADEPRRVRAALKEPIEPALVGFVLPLLADASLRTSARRALRRAGDRIVGQLGDALLDEGLALDARRQLPAVLGQIASRRAVAALLAAQASRDEDLRQRAVRALSELAPTLPVPRREVFAAVTRELEREEVSLPFVFALLGLVLEAAPLKHALGALAGDDERLIGTSLEYLENVLPPTLFTRLSPHLRSYRPGS